MTSLSLDAMTTLIIDPHCDSISTNMSIKSAPQVAARGCSSSSLSSSKFGFVHKSKARSKTDKLHFERGYLKISALMVDEIIKYRRMLLLLIFVFLYSLFAFCAAVLKSPSHGSLSSSQVQHSEWSQEMIAGWHQDRALSLSSDSNRSETKLHHKGRIRECRSGRSQRAQKQQLEQQQKESGELQVRRRRKFEALNGCLFRREASSESVGDICCCAGLPRFVSVVDSIGAQANNSQLSSNSTAINNSSNIAGSGRARRKYLRPQLLCFSSAAADLFNGQKLVAPIANEESLKNTFAPGKGKCITCSCCHEHEPDKVNKLLANVPLNTLFKSKFKNMMLDKNGNQLIMPVEGHNDNNLGGFWVSIRNRLTDCMSYLDRFFFWLYDLFELTLLAARYGFYPPNVTDSTSLIQVQSLIVKVEEADSSSSSLRAVQDDSKSTRLNNLFIDNDLYDDFTTTTTTSSTTKAPKRRGKKRKHRRKHKSSTGRPAKSTNSSSFLGNLSSSSTKSPTVIINVYAGNNNNSPAGSVQSASSSTRAPVEPSRVPLINVAGGPKVDNIKLLIKVAHDANSSAAEQNPEAVRAAQPLLVSAATLRPDLQSSSQTPSSVIINFANQSESAAAQQLPQTQLQSSISNSISRPAVDKGILNKTDPAIVIAVGQGNQTKIIATINATRLASDQQSTLMMQPLQPLQLPTTTRTPINLQLSLPEQSAAQLNWPSTLNDSESSSSSSSSKGQSQVQLSDRPAPAIARQQPAQVDSSTIGELRVQKWPKVDTDNNNNKNHFDDKTLSEGLNLSPPLMPSEAGRLSPEGQQAAESAAAVAVAVPTTPNWPPTLLAHNSIPELAPTTTTVAGHNLG